ncbi:hypothetical protein, partial [Enterobacter cloacae complex sp. 4DZ3-17B2]|uniref:hypothetical protein n=1 Tax=Enterobacter cloacae complex sp. 4DZ3-17B2 TaxID=2511990 RepID=UPI001CA57D32
LLYFTFTFIHFFCISSSPHKFSNSGLTLPVDPVFSRLCRGNGICNQKPLQNAFPSGRNKSIE